MPTRGTILLSLSSIAQTLGPFLADYSHTHIFNPNWPPHAKFHNGQTMSMGLCLGLTSLYYAFRPTTSVEARKDSLRTAAINGSLYWITGLSAVLCPGSLAVDPEFGTGFPQFWPFAGLGIAGWVGCWVETRRVHKERVVKSA